MTDLPQAAAAPAANSRPVVLQGRALSKTFQSPAGPIEVLKDADLHVHRGESVSIRGESGAGKTTLLYLLGGLESADTGALLWEGENVLGRPPGWLARRRGGFMGFVFQAYYLIPELNALENVLMGRRMVGPCRAEDRKRAADLLERVGLGHRLQHLPLKMSGGESQRVAVARALINKPRCILADEPTGNLDEKTGEDVMRLLLELCRAEEASLILVTHNPEFAARTDRQLFLHYGAMKDITKPQP